MIPDGFRFPRPTREDLPRLARLAFDVGAIHCAKCRDYHLTWPYLRSMGLNGAGPEYNLRLHVELLGRAAAGRTDPRWLLTGSADAGVLAAVEAAIAAMPPANHAITVVDRCPTPLALCRDHAASTGLQVETILADLMAFEPAAPFDVVLGHQVVLFFRDEDRPALYRRMATWLAPRGRLCLTVADTTPAAAGASEYHAVINRWRIAQIRADVATGAVDLPEDTETFIGRMTGRLERINGDRVFGLDHFIGQLEDAGLSIVEATPMPDEYPELTITRAGRNRHMIIAERREA
ncbi:MAG: class I SAM-dependent methyltransferase [Bauldia sp.]|nr:class I SAM-dependent methyltransferase [Bauldia sp.]